MEAIGVVMGVTSRSAKKCLKITVIFVRKFLSLEAPDSSNASRILVAVFSTSNSMRCESKRSPDWFYSRMV